eukprot:SAG11_NODE_624_length_8113_cov_9.987397_5_plen_196_part_00
MSGTGYGLAGRVTSNRYLQLQLPGGYYIYRRATDVTALAHLITEVLMGLTCRQVTAPWSDTQVLHMELQSSVAVVAARLQAVPHVGGASVRCAWAASKSSGAQCAHLDAAPLSQVRVAELVGVCTNAALRRRGYGTQLLDLAAAELGHAGFDLAVLACRQELCAFYTGCGYTTVAGGAQAVLVRAPYRCASRELR